MKRLALFATMFTLFGVSIFGETIDPPPLKVHQVCGQAFAANARVEIRRQPLGEAVANTVTSENGEFFFSGLPTGRMYLVMPGFGAGISYRYPIELEKPLTSKTCRKPLFIRPMTGSESGIIVSF